jgi:hypothetical protein
MKIRRGRMKSTVLEHLYSPSTRESLVIFEDQELNPSEDEQFAWLEDHPDAISFTGD